MNIFIIDYNQDDPKKCTGKKLIRLGLAKLTRTEKGIVLNPYSNITLSIDDKEIALRNGITAIDASWNIISQNSLAKRNNHRRLPILFAGNPTHYAIAYKLSTLEALAASLYILDEVKEAIKLLNTIKWGHTFLELNRELLESYRGKKEKEILEIEKEILDKILREPTNNPASVHRGNLT
ncbi:hypothetical protein KN1_18740 [Stygiolobus caldivivus]|uniref:16S rRNA aminocarboxypropyltransferase n=1 Tax=Stygiolobus caldivivus TaxID=2824673 RepID=A0A8D5ZJU9_9CREN|nr:hypothetical protein KN1_18740 [Stygiolobus caldivivus]